jgi:hypothetical protein
MHRDLFLAAKTVAAGTGFNLGAVLRDAFQRDQALGRDLVVRAEARQRAMTNGLQPAQPLATRLVFAPPRQFARRTDPAAVGVQLQTDQQLRVSVLASRAAFHGGDLRVIPRKSSRPTNSQMERTACPSSTNFSTSRGTGVSGLFMLAVYTRQFLPPHRFLNRFQTVSGAASCLLDDGGGRVGVCCCAPGKFDELAGPQDVELRW